MTNSESCPCGERQPYENCCKPLHQGERKAKTAEQLMRSRYAAFHEGEIDYLIETLHPSKRSASDRQSLANTSQNCDWLKLQIHEVENGTEEDESGFVEFSAYFKEKNFGVFREKSRFVKENGLWFYIEGEIKKPHLPGRNDPCWCGSDRKYKKCHGK